MARPRGNRGRVPDWNAVTSRRFLLFVSQSSDFASTSGVIPGCARLGAGPESITADRGYGFRARAEDGAPRNDAGGFFAVEPRPSPPTRTFGNPCHIPAPRI